MVLAPAFAPKKALAMPCLVAAAGLRTEEGVEAACRAFSENPLRLSSPKKALQTAACVRLPAPLPKNALPVARRVAEAGKRAEEGVARSARVASTGAVSEKGIGLGRWY